MSKSTRNMLWLIALAFGIAVGLFGFLLGFYRLFYMG